MIAVLLVILFLGGDTSAFLDYISESKELVETVMAKDERQQEALNLLELMEQRSNDHDKQVKMTFDEFGKLIEGRENNLVELAAIGDSHLKNIESFNSDILDLRFEFREHVTREEWAQIFPKE